MKVYKVGILGKCCTHGAGLCAMFKARLDTDVLAAYEKNPLRAQQLEETLGRSLADSYDEVILHPEIDFVAVSCDPCDKADLVERSAEAGKSIFLNKPFCDSLDNAERIAHAVETNAVPLVHDIPMVRWIPSFARILHETRQGVHGKVFGYHHLFGMNFPMDFDLKAVWPERLDPPSKSGGGEMTNMGCYAIDFAVSLFGLPYSLTAKCRKEWPCYREADVEHFGQIVLDYRDFYAFIEAGKQQLNGELRHSNVMTINFEHDTYLIDASAQMLTVNHVPKDYAQFCEGAFVVGPVEQLIRAIEGGPPPTSDAKTGVMATETLMAAYLSIVEEKPVSLPLTSGRNPLVAEPNRN